MASSKLTIGDLVYKLGFENEEEFVKGLESVLKKAEKTTEKSGGDAGKAGGKAAGKGFTDQFKATFGGAALGSFLGAALAGVFSGAVAAAQKFAIDSVREFAVYEQGLLQLKLAGETNLSALSKRIQDTAKATKVFSATDVSLAVGELVKAGYDAETAFALVETGALGASTEVDAATGRFGDLASTSSQLGNILRALGYDTSQAARVMDVMAKAAQDSNLNVSDLVDIVARVGPTAKLAGLEIEDLAAAAANLSNSGMDASLIGTGLRSVLQALINPSGEMKATLDALGVSLVDSNGNLRDWGEVLDGLNELTQRGGEGLQILTQATGSYGSTAASVLGTASDAIQAYTRDLQNAEGATQNMADTMVNSAAGAAAEMRASLANARAELGEQLMPVMMTMYETTLPALVDGLQGVITFFEALKFAVTGTDAVIDQVNANIVKSMQTASAGGVNRAGPEYEAALARQADIMTRIVQLESELASYDRSTDWLGLRKGRMEGELAGLRFELAGVNTELRELDAAAREAARETARFQTAAAGYGTAAAGAADVVAEAYRNLATVRADLKAAQEAFDVAPSKAEQDALAKTILQLKAEEQAILDTIKVREAAAKAPPVTKPKDALVDDAQRVQNDLQRLKLAYGQGEMAVEDYVDAMDAHLRRLDGLYERVASPEQSLAVLRARQVFLDEKKRLEDSSAVKLAAKPFAVVDDAEVKRQQAIADAEARNNQRRIDELVAAEQAYYAWLQAQEDARVAAAKANAEEIAAARLRVGERYKDAVVTAEQAYFGWLEGEEDKREAAAKEREEKIAAARLRVGQQYLADLLEQEAAYTTWLEREAQKRADNAAAQARAAQAASARGALANLYPGAAGNAASSYTTLAERASGSLVKLAQAQRTLGQATRDDVQAALEGQIAAIERLLPIVEEGSERYYELVGAWTAARGALAMLNAEVPDARIPGMGSVEQIKTALRETEATIARIQADIAAGPDTATLAMLESRLAFFQALLNELRQALNLQEQAAQDKSTGDAIQAEADALAGRLMDIAASFPLAIVDGIRNGDIAGALQGALGSAADFFLEQMLAAILGPITAELSASIAKSMAASAAGSAASGAAGAAGGLAALGPTGLVLGGLALVASMLIGSQQRKQVAERPAAAARAAVSGAPSVTYNLTGNVTVNSNAAWSDPAFQARWRAETEALVISLLSKVRRS